MPLQAYGAMPPQPQNGFLRALDHARIRQSPGWQALNASLPTFLLGHSDDPTLPPETCAALSAIAFELMFGSLGEGGNAHKVAGAFSRLFEPYEHIPLARASGIRPDPKPGFKKEQQDWPVCRKWMKELYELRSGSFHGSERTDLSVN